MASCSAASMDRRSLAEVLRDLADDTECDIIIDRRAADKARTVVDLTLNNALMDTAISLLVEQADLDWMWIDNVAYVATKDDIRARKDRKRAAEQEKVRMMQEANPGQPGLPPFPQPGNPPPPIKPLGRPNGVPM